MTLLTRMTERRHLHHAWRVLVRGMMACLMTVVFAQSVSGSEAVPERVDLDLREKTLGEVIAQLSERTHLDVLVNPDVARPEEFDRIHLSLEGRGLSVRHALDWVARSLGTRYRYDPVGKAVWFTSSYAWVGQASAPVEMYTLGGILGDGGQRAFMERLFELFKIPDVFGLTYTVRIRPQDERLVAILPPVLQERLHSVLQAMADTPLPLRAVEPNADEVEIEKVLTHAVFAEYQNMPLPAILSDIAGQCGINIGYDHVPFKEKGMPSLTLHLGERSAREVLEEVCRLTPLRRILFDAPMGVWLTAEEGHWARTGSRELFWETVEVAGYDVSGFSMTLAGEAVAHMVRSQLSLDWREDPSVGVVYQPVRHALIVAGPAELQAQVERVLSYLATIWKP